jgi:hypothetical protein
MNYKIILALFFTFTLQACLIGSGENSKIEIGSADFPKMVGINLQGEKQQLPEAFDAKLNIVAIAFKREQQSDVDSWIKSTNEIISNNSKIKFYEIPLIYELNMFARTWINNGMRRGIPGEVARKRTITVYTDRNKFFKIMSMKEEKIYILLIDNKGRILWRDHGISSPQKINSLTKSIKANL